MTIRKRRASIDDIRIALSEHGHFEVREKPSPEQLKAYYADKYYQSDRPIGRQTYSALERRYIDLKIAQKASLVHEARGYATPGTMLDVGCGEGFALEWFGQRGWDVRGIDYSSAGVMDQNPHLAARVAFGDVFELLDAEISAGNRYDVLWLNNVLEHVLDPAGLLQRMRRLVPGNGLLMVNVPNDGTDLQETLLESGSIDRRFWIAIPDHLSYFDGDSLATLAAANGWSCRDMIADFPIDLFLLHEGSNYVRDRSLGAQAHAARLSFELMLGDMPQSKVIDFYRSMAAIGLGRQISVVLAPEPGWKEADA